MSFQHDNNKKQASESRQITKFANLESLFGNICILHFCAETDAKKARRLGKEKAHVLFSLSLFCNVHTPREPGTD